MSLKTRTGIGNIFVLHAMSGAARFQWAYTIPADQNQRFPPKNLASCSRFNGYDQKTKNKKQKKKKVFARELDIFCLNYLFCKLFQADYSNWPI